MAKTERSPISRRALVIGGSVAAVGFAVRLTAPQETSLAGNEKIISDKAKSLGITYNDEELQLWKRTLTSAGPPIKTLDNLSPQLLEQEAKRRLQIVLEAMGNSKNEYYKRAAKILKSNIDSGTLTTDYPLSMRREKDSTPINARVTPPDIQNGKLVYKLQISQAWILNTQGPFNISTALTHEAEHLENFLIHQESLPQNWTLTKRRQSHIERYNMGGQSYIEEEARGYAREVQSYIAAYGYGDTTGARSVLETYAVAFIQRGYNAASPEWINYVRTDILKIR